MSGQILSFASGSNLAIKIGSSFVAYGTSLSFSDDVSTGSVGGIGSYSYDALEPLQYAARGSFSVMRYSTASMKEIAAAGSPAKVKAPARSAGVQGVEGETDGNSMLQASQFNPVQLLLSRTFDIEVYERQNTSAESQTQKLVFTLKNCRMTGYSMSFSPGSLVGENISFMAIEIVDEVTKESQG